MTLLTLTALAASPDKQVAKLQKKCDKPKVEACVELGQLYMDGTGVEQDFDQAIKLFGFACNANLPAGCVGLARLSLVDERFDLDTRTKVNKKACAMMDAEACAWLNDQLAQQKAIADAEREAFYAAKEAALAARTVTLDWAGEVNGHHSHDLLEDLEATGVGRPDAPEDDRSLLDLEGSVPLASMAWEVLLPAAQIGFSTLLVGEEDREVRLLWAGPDDARVYPSAHADFASGELLPVLVMDDHGYLLLGADHILRAPEAEDLSRIPCPRACSGGYDVETLHDRLWDLKRRNHASNGILVVAEPDVAWANVLRTLDAVPAIPRTSTETSRALFANPYLLVGTVIGDPEPLHPDSANPDKAPDGDTPRRSLRVASADAGSCELDEPVLVAATAVGAPFLSVALGEAPSCASELADTLLPGRIAGNPTVTVFE